MGGILGCWPASLAVFVGAANLVAVLAQAPELVHNLYLNADHASALVLPALASHAPAGSLINLGNHAWYEPWWFMRATAGFSDYRELWEGAPFLSGLLGVAAVTACTWWGLGRLGAVLCGVTLVAASAALRSILYVPESHGLIVLHAGVLCGVLLIVHRLALSRRATLGVLVGLGLPLVAFTGAGLTDQLLLISGWAPFILAPLLCWLRLRSPVWRTTSLFAIATGVLSLLLALLLTHVMQDQGVGHAPFPIDFVGSEALFGNLQNVVTAFASVAGGSFFGTPASGANLLTFVAGAFGLLALAAVLRMLWRWTVSAAGPAKDTRSLEASSRDLFIAYWGCVLVLALGAFAVTSLSATASNSRYLVGAWVAVAALLGTLALTPATRTIIALGVALFGVLNLRSDLASGVPAYGPGPDQRLAGVIEHFATAHGASVGYASYWDAAPVTWETRLRVKVFPIQACDSPASWCPFYNNQISSWYLPRASARTFLLTDSRPGIPLEVSTAPASFGVPIASEVVGEGLTVYIYGHDLATDLTR
jgi:hypothetical protein